jgi:glycosyltransferase 2 family protein
VLSRLRRVLGRVGRAASTPWGRLLTTLVAVVLFVRAVDLRSAISLFRTVEPGWTILAVTLAALSVIASVAEWGVLLRGTGHAMDWSFLGTWYLKGLFVNQVLPAGVGGDAVRALHLGRVTGHGPMVSSLVASRMAGTLGMSLWALAAAILLRDLLRIPVFAGFVIFAAAMIVAWTLALVAEAARDRLRSRHPGLEVVSHFVRPLTATFYEYRCRPRIIAASIVAGTAGWGLNLFSMEAFAIALGRDVSWMNFAVALPIALLATFVPISANGLGVREGVLVALLVHIDVPLGMATALSLFVDLQLLPFALLGGAVWLVEHHAIPRTKKPAGAGTVP